MPLQIKESLAQGAGLSARSTGPMLSKLGHFLANPAGTGRPNRVDDLGHDFLVVVVFSQRPLKLIILFRQFRLAGAVGGTLGWFGGSEAGTVAALLLRGGQRSVTDWWTAHGGFLW